MTTSYQTGKRQRLSACQGDSCANPCMEMQHRRWRWNRPENRKRRGAANCSIPVGFGSACKFFICRLWGLMMPICLSSPDNLFGPNDRPLGCTWVDITRSLHSVLNSSILWRQHGGSFPAKIKILLAFLNLLCLDQPFDDNSDSITVPDHVGCNRTAAAAARGREIEGHSIVLPGFAML